MPAKKSIKKTEPANETMDFADFVAKTKAPSQGNGKGVVFFVLLAVVVILSGILLTLSKKNQTQTVPSYSAIYLDSGQTYYGVIAHEDQDYIYVEDVYYFTTVPQEIPPSEDNPATTTVNSTVLVKRGQELTRPQEALKINRSKVTLIEDLGPESEIAKEIKKNQ